jgi:cytochrome c556
MSRHDARSQFRNRVDWRASLTALALALGLGSLVLAQAATRPEQSIKWRQSAFQVIAWNLQRLKVAIAADGDAHEIQAAANTLAAVAASGLPDLFAPGTGHGKGWRETTAGEAVFADTARFRAQSDEFARSAALLARLAAGTDRAAIKDQFGKVAKTCKSCHDKFRETE